MFQVPGSKEQVPRNRFQVSGSKFQVSCLPEPGLGPLLIRKRTQITRINRNLCGRRYLLKIVQNFIQKLNKMYAIKYIIVNDSAAKGSACESRHRFIPHLGLCVVCDAGFRFQDAGYRCSRGSSCSRDLKHETWNLKRSALIAELCRLRRQWPEAPILGMSELDTSASHAPVRVSASMNLLRREMSDLP